MCTNMGGNIGKGSRTDKIISQKIDFSGLPDLQGSEKQVKWAEQIRSDVVNTINNNIERMEKSKDREYYQPSIEAFKEIGEKVNTMLRQPQGAKAANIIDRRNSSFDTRKLLRMINELEIKKRENRGK